MFKQLYLFLLASVAGVALFFFLLVYFSSMPNKANNGFKRTWLSDKISQINNKKLSFPVTKISGAGTSCFYFATRDPRWILVTNRSLEPVDTLMFGIKPNQELLMTNDITVDSPFVYMLSNTLQLRLHGRVDTFKLDTASLKCSFFTKAAYVSRELLVVRGFDTSQRHQVFKKINARTGLITAENTIIEDQADPGFSSDGLLRYDPTSNRLFYVSYFSNTFYSLDTNLQKVYTARTIDTIEHVQSSIDTVTEKGITKLVPRYSREIVNKDFYTGDGYMFVLSGLRADNEKLESFNQNIVVDVYSSAGGHYTGSFYLPKGEARLSSLYYKNNLLIALYSNQRALTFKVNLPTLLAGK